MKKLLIIISLIFVIVSCSSNEVEMRDVVEERELPVVNEEIIEDISEVQVEEKIASVEGTEGMSEADVAIHNTKEDCYTIIDGKVYDITNFFGKHGGGDDKILGLCGIDGTDKFTNQHGQNEKAIMTRDSFYIGELSK